MQVAIYAGLLERVGYHLCRMYLDQLSPGGNYAPASPLVFDLPPGLPLLPNTTQAHYRFQMLHRTSGRELDNAIEEQTVELTK
jgi:hypothetical protein